MELKLISENKYNKIKNIQKNYPVLTFQNKGYQYINKNNLSKKDEEKIKQIEEILNKSIKGFSKFNNFRLSDENEIVIRFQYNYNYDGVGIPFMGVGYIYLEELLKGFHKYEEKTIK